QRPVGRNPGHARVADWPAGALRAADPDSAVPPAWPAGDTRNVTSPVQTSEVRMRRQRRTAGFRVWPWLVALVICIALPWVFYDWHHGRHSGFMLSMLSQMGMMVIFALSFNMLLGQAGLLSFCHSVLFGFGGYTMVHLLNAAGAGELPVPME